MPYPETDKEARLTTKATVPSSTGAGAAFAAALAGLAAVKPRKIGTKNTGFKYHQSCVTEKNTLVLFLRELVLFFFVEMRASAFAKSKR